MSQLVSLITAFGLGSIVTALIQSWLSRRTMKDERSFKEKQAAYVGLLEAWREAAAEGNVETPKPFGFGYWHWRCELVGSPAVRDAVRRITETNDDPVGRSKAVSDMKEAMRADLGITR